MDLMWYKISVRNVTLLSSILLTCASTCIAEGGKQIQDKLKRVFDAVRLICNKEDLAKFSFTNSKMHCSTLQSRWMCYIVEYIYWQLAACCQLIRYLRTSKRLCELSLYITLVSTLPDISTLTPTTVILFLRNNCPNYINSGQLPTNKSHVKTVYLIGKNYFKQQGPRFFLWVCLNLKNWFHC